MCAPDFLQQLRTIIPEGEVAIKGPWIPLNILYCLTVTLYKTQRKNQKAFQGRDQHPFDATSEPIDELIPLCLSS